MGPLVKYNLSWCSHDLPLFTIPANVAALQEQEFAFPGVVGSLPLMYGANIWDCPQLKEQLKVGQPPCLWGSSRTLKYAGYHRSEGLRHPLAFLFVW
jgi:hypothetical protein